MRETFIRELQRLEQEVIRLGSEVEEHLTLVVNAFVSRDMYTARLMIEADQAVNERRIQLGMNALRLIATQQPMAGDMRMIGAVLEIVGELERIHDYVKGIGKISLNLGPTPILPSLAQSMPEMVEITARMLNQSLLAFAERDADLARQVPLDDDKVDALFNQSYGDLVEFCMSNASEIHRANHLEWALHNLERAADRTINICEWVIYMVTGVYSEFSVGEFEAPPESTD